MWELRASTHRPLLPIEILTYNFCWRGYSCYYVVPCRKKWIGSLRSTILQRDGSENVAQNCEFKYVNLFRPCYVSLFDFWKLAGLPRFSGWRKPRLRVKTADNCNCMTAIACRKRKCMRFPKEHLFFQHHWLMFCFLFFLVAKSLFLYLLRIFFFSSPFVARAYFYFQFPR